MLFCHKEVPRRHTYLNLSLDTEATCAGTICGRRGRIGRQGATYAQKNEKTTLANLHRT